MLSWPDRVLLLMLTIDGFIVGVLSVAFAYLRFDGVAIPVAAIAAGVLNAILLWLAAGYTDGPLRYGPLLGWLIVLVIGSLPGPGGDVALTPDGALLLPTALLVIIGGGIPAGLAWSGRLPTPITDRRAHGVGRTGCRRTVLSFSGAVFRGSPR